MRSLRLLAIAVFRGGAEMTSRRLLAMALVAAAALSGGCGTAGVAGLDQFVSREFGFSIAVPQDMAGAGWLIVRAQDATVQDSFSPPDSSAWERVAVVAPPSGSYPLLAPFFVNIFRPKNPAATAQEIGGLRAGRVSDTLISRRSYTVNGSAVEELVFGGADFRIYESYIVAAGLGYVVRTAGPPLSSQLGQSLFVDAQAYVRVVQTFDLLAN